MLNYIALQHTNHKSLRAVAYVTKGLSDVALAEITELVQAVKVIAQEDRFVIVELPIGQLEELRRRARTIDDLRALVAGPAKVSSEQEFVRLCSDVYQRTRQFLSEYDEARLDRGPWSITISARNPVWEYSGGWDPGDVISEWIPGAEASSKVRHPVDVRFQVDGEQIHVSVNLCSSTVGKHGQRGATRPGALRPTVAASLVRIALANADPAAKRLGVYDPFCGSGTIVAEAAHLGLPVFASDVDEGAVELTRTRLAEILNASGSRTGRSESDLSHRVFRHDVRRGMPPRVNACIIASNLPWGKQVKVDRHSELFDAVAVMVASAVQRGGACALLTTHEQQLVARIRRRCNDVLMETRPIGLLGQTPAIVTIRKAS